MLSSELTKLVFIAIAFSTCHTYQDLMDLILNE